MSTTIQGSRKIKGSGEATMEMLPLGFTYGALTGAWTSTAAGDYWLLTEGSNVGQAVNELGFGDGITQDLPANYNGAIPSEPLFDYIFTTDGLITKVVSVLTNNRILVTSDLGVSGAAIQAVTSKVGCPTSITLMLDTGVAQTYKVAYPEQAAITYPNMLAPVVLNNGNGSMIPLLLADPSGGQLSAIINY